jgi:hypothetical protein
VSHREMPIGRRVVHPISGAMAHEVVWSAQRMGSQRMQIPGQNPKVGCNVGRQEPGRSGGVGGAILASSRVRRLVGVDFSHSRTMSSVDACCRKPVACCASKPARVIGRQPRRNLLRVCYTSINGPPRSHRCSACRCGPRYGRTSLQIEHRRKRGKKDVCKTTIRMVVTIIDYNTSNISATLRWSGDVAIGATHCANVDDTTLYQCPCPIKFSLQRQTRPKS